MSYILKQRVMLALIMITSLSYSWYGCSRKLGNDKLTGYNVILILIDTLRADHLGCYGYFAEKVYYFLNHLETAEIITEKANFVKVGATEFTINNDKRHVLFEHPDSEAIFRDVLIHENSVIKFGFGISESAWDKAGDGVLFEIYLLDESSHKFQLFSKYIDPKTNMEDRRWFDSQVDLITFGGQKVTFIFKTIGGRSTRYDWAGWSDVKVIPYSEFSEGLASSSGNAFINSDKNKNENSVFRRQTSPNIDDFARQATLFKNAFSSSSWTRPATASILTSKFPIEHQITAQTNQHVLSDSFLTIQEFYQR